MKYPSDRYRSLVNDILQFGEMLIRGLGDVAGKPESDIKTRISIGFLSRSLIQFSVISDLSYKGNFPDAYILFRSLLERLLFYIHLIKRDEFRIFDDWCFKQVYEYRNRIKSSSDVKHKLTGDFWQVTEKQTERYKQIKKDPRVKDWKRPKAKDIAKDRCVMFLYDVGYDLASGFVHPTSTEGVYDYPRLVGLPTDHLDIDLDLVLHNSCITIAMHLQEILNAYDFEYRRELLHLIDGFRTFLGDPTFDYSERFAKVIRLSKSDHLFRINELSS
ncbi:DUF5677 domain-containing protein [Dehalococcoidia bacterium]|nr:DUF5677 domain-containing protein [Dehalococcoidia bacterium]